MALRSPKRRATLKTLVVISWLTSSAFARSSSLYSTGVSRSSSETNFNRLDDNETFNYPAISPAEAAYFNAYKQIQDDEHPFFVANYDSNNNHNNNFNDDNRTPITPSRFDQLNSFYSLGEPTAFNNNNRFNSPGQYHSVSRDEQIEPILLQSHGLELTPELRPGRQLTSTNVDENLASKQLELNRMTQQVIDAHNQKTQFEQVANGLTEHQRAPAYRTSLQKSLNLRLAPNNVHPSSPPHRTLVHQYRAQMQQQQPPATLMNAVYRPSILERTKNNAPVNLISVLQPTNDNNNQYHQQQASRQQAIDNGNQQSVSIDEIEDLLRRLKPLALKESEKHIGNTEEDAGDSNDDGYSSNEQESDDESDGKEGAKESSAMANQTAIFSSLPGAALSNSDSNQILLNSLSNLGSRLKHSTENFIGPLEIGLNELGGKKRQEDASSSPQSSERSYPNPAVRDMRWYGRGQDIGVAAGAIQSIPIDLLVDHLMSSSRLIRSGRNRDDTIGHIDEGQVGEDDDDDEYDDEQTNESSLNIAKVPEKTLEGNSLALNDSDSWIPIAPILLNNNSSNNNTQALLIQDISSPNKKKRRNKRKSGDVNLVIGGKQLSRTDLIKLIKILNKKASKRGPSKGRDASRKLLRFLVKLALDKYKRIQTGDEPSSVNSTKGSKGTTEKENSVHNLLRSIIMSPVDMSRPGNETNSIELRPLLEKNEQPQQRETDSESPEEKDVDSVKVSEVNKEQDRDPDQSSGNQQETSGYDGDGDDDDKKNTKSSVRFNKLSDDMEQYFDSDFFEDLADKITPGNNSSETKDSKVRIRPKRRRSSRQGSNLPTPVHSKQQVVNDEADDDYDGDDAQRSSQLRPRRWQRHHRWPTEDVQRRLSLRRQRGSRSGQYIEPRSSEGRRQRRPPSRERYYVDDRDQDDGEEDRQPKSDIQLKRHRPQQQRRWRIPPGRRRSSRVVIDGQSRRQSDHGDDQADYDDEDDDTTAIVENEENQVPQDSRRTGGNNQDLISPESIGEDTRVAGNRAQIKFKNSSKRQRFKRRRPRKRNVSRSVGQVNMDVRDERKPTGEVDLDSRDEIPAPIEKGKSMPELRASLLNNSTNHMKSDYSAIKLGSPQPPTPPPQSNRPSHARPRTVGLGVSGSTRKTIARHPVGNNVSNGIIGKERRSPLNEINDSDEPASEGEQQHEGEDEDYYNEGTNYSKLCDDEGKCKVTVQSSNPKLNKAIEVGDQPVVDKQLGKWVTEQRTD